MKSRLTTERKRAYLIGSALTALSLVGFLLAPAPYRSVRTEQPEAQETTSSAPSQDISSKSTSRETPTHIDVTQLNEPEALQAYFQRNREELATLTFHYPEETYSGSKYGEPQSNDLKEELRKKAIETAFAHSQFERELSGGKKDRREQLQIIRSAERMVSNLDRQTQEHGPSEASADLRSDIIEFLTRGPASSARSLRSDFNKLRAKRLSILHSEDEHSPFILDEQSNSNAKSQPPFANEIA